MYIEQGFDIHGVRVGLGSSDERAFERLVALLPRDTPRCDPEAVEERFKLMPTGENAWHYMGPTGASGMFADLTFLLGMLDTALRSYVAANVRDRVFVHAGAVAHRSRAILIPGSSFSGKSTLVAALVRAGAEYYSDEFAVFDEQGLLYPYARPVAIRRDDPEMADRHSVESLGGRAGEKPIPVGLIIATTYRPRHRFEPQPVSAGQGMLKVLEHAVHAHERAEEVMSSVRAAAAGAVTVVGDRGEAHPAARAILALAESEASRRDSACA